MVFVRVLVRLGFGRWASRRRCLSPSKVRHASTRPWPAGHCQLVTGWSLHLKGGARTRARARPYVHNYPAYIHTGRIGTKAKAQSLCGLPYVRHGPLPGGSSDVPGTSGGARGVCLGAYRGRVTKRVSAVSPQRVVGAWLACMVRVANDGAWRLLSGGFLPAVVETVWAR